MTEDTYERAQELKKSMDILKIAREIMCYPYPEIELAHDSEHLRINFVSLDENTRDELKKAIKDVLDKRFNELIEEFNSL